MLGLFGLNVSLEPEEGPAWANAREAHQQLIAMGPEGLLQLPDCTDADADCVVRICNRLEAAAYIPYLISLYTYVWGTSLSYIIKVCACLPWCAVVHVRRYHKASDVSERVLQMRHTTGHAFPFCLSF